MYGEVRTPRRPWLLTPVLIAGIAVVFLVSRWPNETGMTFGYTIQSIALIGIFIPVILAPRSIVGRLLNLKAVAWVGIISYSIYLIHRPALTLAEEYLTTPQLTTATVGIAATVLAAWAMMIFVERPFGRLRLRANRAGEIENNGAD
jgi:peptidoglycan/LPS O-acetylase OafA/YrhL